MAAGFGQHPEEIKDTEHLDTQKMALQFKTGHIGIHGNSTTEKSPRDFAYYITAQTVTTLRA